MRLPAFLRRPFESHGIARALRHRDFALFAAGAFVSTMGMWVQQVAIGWLTWELTHSGAWLGIIALSNSLPSLILVPFAGAIGDRVDRLKLYRVTQTLAILFTTILAAVTLLDWITIEFLLAYTLVVGVNATLSMPARMSLTPGLVPHQDLSAAIALNSVFFSIAGFAGPALAGLFIAKLGVGYAFAFNAASYLPFYTVLWFIRLRTHEHRPGAGLIADMAEGIRFVFRHPGIGPILLLTGIASVLIRPLPDILPGFADAVFGRGPEGLATLMAAYGLGGILGALWLAQRGRTEGATAIYFLAVAAAALFTLAFASTDHYAIALAVIVVLGAFRGITTNASQILIQNAVAGPLRARVMSIYSLTFRSGPALGAMLMGGLSTLVGFQLPFQVGALLTLIGLVWFARRRRALAIILEAPLERDAGGA